MLLTRFHLLQARWFEDGAGMEAEYLVTLRALPIFEMAPPPFIARSTHPQEPSFTNLLGMRTLAPQVICGFMFKTPIVSHLQSNHWMSIFRSCSTC